MLTNEQRDALQAWAVDVLPRATAYARSLVPDPVRAEDLVQECLYQLLRRADAYDLLRDGVPLLFRSISNLCITRATRDKTLRSLDGTADEGSVEVPDPTAWSPELLAQGRELGDAIHRGLQALPELQRAAVELRALGMSKVQIAEVLQVSPSNAAVLVHRGRKALAAELGLSAYPMGFEESV
jgi:RNA polymerase sigma factor (sigma-70 family)